MPSVDPKESSAAELADDLAMLFHRLGFAVLIRDPHTADVVAASPDAEALVLAAQPGTVRVATARLRGAVVRVEMVPHASEERIQLTPRQTAVARLLASGSANPDIAEALGISAHTVRRHLESIYRELGVANRAASVVELRKGRAKL